MKPPLRVLHVFAVLDRGGAESRTMDIYRKIDKTKVQFDFVAYKNDYAYAFEEEIQNLGGRVYHMPRYKASGHFAFRKAWKQLLKNHPEWSVIHVHNTSTAVFWIGIAKKLKRKVIAHSRTAGGTLDRVSISKVLMRYPLRYKADYLFAVSEKAAQWMFGKYGSQTTIIRNAIDVNTFVFNLETRNRKRHELGLNDNNFIIGHVGRFVPEKKHDFIVDIFAEIIKLAPNSILLFVGDGLLREEISDKVKTLSLTDNVIFAGERADVADFLQAMDIFLFPSLFEGMPGAVIEAQAAGLNCLISDTITDEVRITDLVESLSLSLTADVWANKAVELLNEKTCRDTKYLIKAAGFDVIDVAEQLCMFYGEIDTYKN